MKPEALRAILAGVAGGELSVDEALSQLRRWPVEELGFARVDHHRHVRRGMSSCPAAGRTRTVQGQFCRHSAWPMHPPIPDVLSICRRGAVGRQRLRHRGLHRQQDVCGPGRLRRT